MAGTSPAPLFVAKEPKLWPNMLLPRPGRQADRFPFTDPSIRYHYLGRNAAYALVRALGLQDQEVLFPAWFGGPVLEAPRQAGAKIRFYPVRTGARVEPEDILAAITPETRAVYLIHFVGFPGPVKEVREICRERGLKLIEDCAHALYTTLDGQPLGTFGDGAVFSFYKWIPVPNGAALTMTNGDETAMQRADVTSLTSGAALSAFSTLDNLALRFGAPGRLIRSSARAAGRSAGHTAKLNYIGTGGIDFREDQLTYAMSGIAHRILANQNVDDIIARRRHNYEHLADLLGDVAPPVTGPLPAGVTPLFYPTRVLYKRAVLDRLRQRGVEGRSFWEYYHPTLAAGLFTETDDLRETVLELPIHQDVTPDAIERMARIVRETVGAKPAPAPGRNPRRFSCACDPVPVAI
jgi:dTDP-4-amino-4,6-dideoxygalactose transaminase